MKDDDQREGEYLQVGPESASENSPDQLKTPSKQQHQPESQSIRQKVEIPAKLLVCISEIHLTCVIADGGSN